MENIKNKKEDCNFCILCGLTQEEHKTNMHVFGIQIGCSWSAIKDYKLGTKDSKKTISQEQ
ncbi:MAG: hypothetical protein CL890_02835 [Dehalococcoidia bacterium]|nr:hypothetical protein [Dehalococcoidia bacterium]